MMLHIGVGGYPPVYSKTSFRNDRMSIFEWLRGLGLNAFEAMMPREPWTMPRNCQLMGELSREYNIRLSVHAASSVVFTSPDKEKVRHSSGMLERTFELADVMGADTVVLHPGPLYKRDSDAVIDTLSNNITRFFRQTGQTNIGLFLETAGDKAGFGSVEEILSVTNQVDGCYPCVDFGHVHARSGGGLETSEDIDEVFVILENNGVFAPGGRVHFHYTPIHNDEVQPRGADSFPGKDDALASSPRFRLRKLYKQRYDKIIGNLSKLTIPVTIISEFDNNQEKGGALAMHTYYKSLNFERSLNQNA